jgi:adenylate cyclase
MRRATLIYNPESPKREEHPFVDQCVVGRRRGPTSDTEGSVRISDPAISGRHCVVRQTSDGKFLIRDESRNGTRVDGRRLVPNVEVEIFSGAKIQVAKDHFLVLEVEPAEPAQDAQDDYEDVGATRALVNTMTEVTVLVGDIAGYTTLNQRYAAADVIKPVNRVFAELEGVVNEFHGSIKEYQGDAMFAFWERDEADPNWHTIQACRCALALQKKVAELAQDPGIWSLKDEYPLEMEWALTTGDVIITAIGGDRVIGMAMVGDCVNYAFRLEKLAGKETGKVLACQHTERRARSELVFRSLGEHEVKGRVSEVVYALDGAREQSSSQRAETAVLDLHRK